LAAAQSFLLHISSSFLLTTTSLSLFLPRPFIPFQRPTEDMSYPFSNQPQPYYTGGAGTQRQPQPQQQQADYYFDPYSEGQRQPHPTYDQGAPYRDEYFQAPYAHGTGSTGTPASGSPPREKDQPFSAEVLGLATPRGNSAALRRYRYENNDLWTRGGGLRCCGRLLCCTLFIALWMIIGIILALVLYLRPPNVVIGNAQLATTNQVQNVDGGLKINVEIPIEVINPSYLDVDLSKVYATIFYPINHTRIGNGSLTDTKLPAFTTMNFTFPFSLEYTSDIDPSQAIITDILNKCLGKEQLTVQYDLTVGVKVLSVTVSPSISNNASFACPFDASSASSVLGGLNVSSIIGGITGNPAL